MKKILLLAIVVILSAGIQKSFAQEKNVTKSEKKAQKQKFEDAQWNQLKQIIDDKQFVFRGNILNSTKGTTTLNPKINFVSIQGDRALVQMASGFGGGQNGIGGYTIDGLIENYSVKTKGVGKGININFTVMPRVGQGVDSQPINININAFSFDSARLSIGSGSTSMQGDISTNADAKIFEGNTPN